VEGPRLSSQSPGWPTRSRCSWENRSSRGSRGSSKATFKFASGASSSFGSRGGVLGHFVASKFALGAFASGSCGQTWVLGHLVASKFARGTFKSRGRGKSGVLGRLVASKLALGAFQGRSRGRSRVLGRLVVLRQLRVRLGLVQQGRCRRPLLRRSRRGVPVA
jgi:hypothetical protein